jgi:aminoglycoside 6'-N-acetyltransferase
MVQITQTSIQKPMNITLRQAIISDLPLLKYWDKKPHVIFATGGDSDDEEDEWMKNQLQNPSKFVWIYIAELDSRPIGVIQIVDPANEETHYWGKIEQGLRAMDIWIGEESDLAKGYGTTMMQLAINKCFENPEVTAILIDPLSKNLRAIKFYQKLGFVFLENRDFDDDNCDIYIKKRITIE